VPASSCNRREIAERLRYLPLATSFRSADACDSVLYLVAGEVIEAVSGQSWEDFISSRILAKVGLTTSHLRLQLRLPRPALQANPWSLIPRSGSSVSRSCA
jgi:CubicO group peptidase (beta-lactamase class C family)